MSLSSICKPRRMTFAVSGMVAAATLGRMALAVSGMVAAATLG